MDKYAATLALLEPEELESWWRMIRLLEREGKMDSMEAQRWRDGIFRLMERWNLEPSHLAPPIQD